MNVVAAQTEVAVRERPILFSAPMVRAILSGAKTQTRRVVLRPESYERIHECAFCCPYGKPGEQLWVRESVSLYREPTDAEREATQRAFDDFAEGRVKDIVEAAAAIPRNNSGPQRALYRADMDGDGEWLADCGPWTPSIHMPRWASRIALVLVGVRIQRLRDIDEDDAKAEGITEPAQGRQGHWSYRKPFADLWDSINSKRPGRAWADNPWVWALTFRRIDNAPPASAPASHKLTPEAPAPASHTATETSPEEKSQAKK